MSQSPRILFASYHGYFDPSSGAALATRDLLESLSQRGWECGVLCGPMLDHELLTDRRIYMAGLGLQTDPQIENGFLGCNYQLFKCVVRGVRSVVFEPLHWKQSNNVTKEEQSSFLEVFQKIATWFQPDIILTYGGNSIGQALMVEAKKMRLRVVFALHNFGYPGPEAFQRTDVIFVPSRFAQREYARRGLTTSVLPCPMNPSLINVKVANRQFVTFVNPVPAKGVFIMAKILEELGTRRPDIKFLVVESRGAIDWLGKTGVDLSKVTSVHRMANTNNPADFYAISRIVVMPSLWQESLGRVAIESMLNGIPVLASDRGSLPETLGEAGICLSIPEHLTPETRIAPSTIDIQPWCDEIERLWDDANYYADRCRLSENEGERWQSEKLTTQAVAFFEHILKQDCRSNHLFNRPSIS